MWLRTAPPRGTVEYFLHGYYSIRIIITYAERRPRCLGFVISVNFRSPDRPVS